MRGGLERIARHTAILSAPGSAFVSLARARNGSEFHHGCDSGRLGGPFAPLPKGSLQEGKT